MIDQGYAIVAFYLIDLMWALARNAWQLEALPADRQDNYIRLSDVTLDKLYAKQQFLRKKLNEDFFEWRNWKCNEG